MNSAMFIKCKKCGSAAKHAHFDWQKSELVCRCGETLIKVTPIKNDVPVR